VGSEWMDERHAGRRRQGGVCSQHVQQIGRVDGGAVHIPELHRAAQGATAGRQQWSRMHVIGQAAAKWDDGEEYEGDWVRG
jgi:hypothetical protein